MGFLSRRARMQIIIYTWIRFGWCYRSSRCGHLCIPYKPPENNDTLTVVSTRTFTSVRQAHTQTVILHSKNGINFKFNETEYIKSCEIPDAEKYSWKCKKKKVDKKNLRIENRNTICFSNSLRKTNNPNKSTDTNLLLN